MDTRVANAGTWGIRGLNGNGKNTIETIKKKCNVCLFKKVRNRQIPYNVTYIWNLKNKINEQTKQEQTHRYRKHFGDCPMGRDSGGWVKKRRD